MTVREQCQPGPNVGPRIACSISYLQPAHCNGYINIWWMAVSNSALVKGLGSKRT